MLKGQHVKYNTTQELKVKWLQLALPALLTQILPCKESRPIYHKTGL